jgi:hypothetical protein
MMTRAEKLFCIRAQVQRAASEIEHGDTYASCMALGDALSGVIRFLEEEQDLEGFIKRWGLEHSLEIDREAQNHLKGERVKAPDPETRAALDALRAEPTKIKRR